MNYSHSYLTQQQASHPPPAPPSQSHSHQSQSYQLQQHHQHHHHHPSHHSSTRSANDTSHHIQSAQTYCSSQHHHSLSQELSENEISHLFVQCDKDGDGYLNVQELQSALGGSFTPFNLHICSQMISIFDHRHRGIKLEEFYALWKYLTDWQNVFRSFDKEGGMESRDFYSALSYFGYRLNPSIATLVLNKYDRQGKGILLLEDWIQCCIIMQSVTYSFRDMDRDQDGFITISHDQFLNVVTSIVANC